MDGPRVLLSTWATGDTGIRSWDTTTGTVTKITRRPANLVDIGNDLLASLHQGPLPGRLHGAHPAVRPDDPAVEVLHRARRRLLPRR